MDAILKVEHLSKQYDGFQLNDINFELPRGCIMGLIGENGAGKSTTINAMLDLIHKDEGKVSFFGESLEHNEQIKEDIGIVFDSINFYETLTAKKLEMILKKMYKQWDREAYHNYLNEFSLPLNKEIKALSKGMQMKLSIAIALSHHPKLLILDEATSGLDPIIRDEVLEIFLTFVQDEDHAILVSSHITSDLEKIADYITFIHDGHVQFSKNKDELIYEYGIMKCTPEQLQDVDATDIIVHRKMDYGWQVLVDHKAEMIEKYPDFIIDHATIDDIMLLHVKGEQ